MKTMTLRALPAILLALFSGAASAAAFQNWEQNAATLGHAHAGSAAVADNAAGLFFNPAGMTHTEGVQFSAGIAGQRPRFAFEDGGSAGPALGAGDGGDAGRWLATPNAALSWRVNKDLALGLGISSPFGLDLEYDANWLGRVHAGQAEIRTRNFNPAIAYRVSDRVAVGFGLNYQTLDVDLANAVSRMKGDDGSWGWNAGVLFTLSPAMRLGIAYRSAVKHELEGTADGQAARADVKLPDTAILSVWQQVSDRWEAMGDLSYTRWDTVKGLSFVDRSNGLPIAGEAFTYGNSWRVAWGAAYLVSDDVKLKFGIAYERSPVSNGGRTAVMPDSDSVRFSIGGQWNAGRYGRVDAGYAYRLMKDAKIAQARVVGGPTTTLRGEYEAGAHVVGVQYSLGF